MKKFSVDRIEDGIVTLQNENSKNIDVELILLPSDIKEGDVIFEENGVYTLSSEETLNAKKNISELRKKMLSKFSKG